MKRIYLLLMLLAATAFNLAAQDDGYKPFVEEGKRWVWYSTTLNYIGGNFSYLIKGDSLVGEHNYKKVWYTDSRNNTWEIGLVREEGSRVYLKGDFILYDFSDPTNSEYHHGFSLIPTTRQGRSGFRTDDSEFLILQGIGIDAVSAGRTFEPMFDYFTCDCYYHLNYVADAQGNVVYYGLGYMQPLVREGVVWHYAYQVVPPGPVWEYLDNPEIVDHKVEFRGDTVIGGQEYKKCYLYETEQLDPTATKPVAFMRETNGVVRVIYDDLSTARYASKPYTYDSDENNDNDEKVIYDFFNFYYLMETALPNEYTATVGPKSTTEEEVQLGDLPVPVHRYQYKDYIDVEGVGADAPLSGYLFDPYPALPTCFCSMPLGLIKLEDSNGNLLYKGYYYDSFYSSVERVASEKADIRFDGTSVRVACGNQSGAIDIINSAGVVVGRSRVEAGSAVISTTHLPAGVYIVQLSTPAGRQTAKIVVR